MPSTIITKNGSGAPLAADLVAGELAVDLTNGRLYTEDTGGSVIEIGLNPSGNVDVTGTVTADGLTVDGDAEVSSTSPTLYLMESDTTDTNWRARVVAGDLYLGRVDDAKANTGYSALFDANGDISFYEDTGTTAKLFWDASAESLGIGTSSNLNDQLTVGSSTDAFTAKVSGAVTTIRLGGHDSSIAAGRFDYDRSTGNLTYKEGTYDSEGSALFSILYDGRTGIGTDSPVTSLTLGSGTTGVSFKSADASINSGKIAVIKPVEVGSGNGHLVFETYEGGSGGTERMRIDSAGRVGIGTDSPSNTLEVASDADNGGITIYNDFTSGGRNARIGFKSLNSYDASSVLAAITATPTSSANTSTSLVFQTSGDNSLASAGLTERMRIDSSGSLLVGTTVNDGQSIGSGSQDGTVITGESQYIQRADNANLWLSKPSGASNSEFIKFYDNGTQVGSIGTTLGSLYIQDDDTGLFFNRASNNILPIGNGTISDNSIDLGRGSARFKDLYLSGGVNQSTVLVSALPAAASSTGYRFMVSDSTVAASGNFGATVAGTGSNVVPVFSDGTNWLIG